jgi:hypothetical protein
MAKIQLLGGLRHGTEVNVAEDGFILGTAGDFLIDADGVAPRHAKIYKEKDAFWIEGLEGREFFVNFQKTSKSRLFDRDVVVLGKAAFRFLTESEETLPLSAHRRAIAAKDAEIAALKRRSEELKLALQAKDTEIAVLKDGFSTLMQQTTGTIEAFKSSLIPQWLHTQYEAGVPIEPPPPSKAWEEKAREIFSNLPPEMEEYAKPIVAHLFPAGDAETAKEGSAGPTRPKKGEKPPKKGEKPPKKGAKSPTKGKKIPSKKGKGKGR